MTLKKRTAVFGFGAMGSALVKGWIESGMMPPAAITAVEVDDDKRKAAVRKLGIKATVNPKEALKGAGLALLAVKPQQMKELLEKEGQHFSPGVLVVSIAAGVSTRQIEKGLPQGNPVVRVMPNTPALLGAGMAAVAAGSRAKEAHVKLVLKLFSAVGKSVRVNEAQMDLVTGLSGSGPAYFFNMIEAMAEAGVKLGLDEKTALQLTAQTAYGAARMVLESGSTPEQLRVQVTSPGGTTQAGLTVLKEKGFREMILAAIDAATRRGAELRKMND